MTTPATGPWSFGSRLGPLRGRGRRQGPNAGEASVADPELGSRIALARRRAGLTAKELGRRIGLSLWHVQRLERDAVDATPHLLAIADATGRPVSWFQETVQRTPIAASAPSPSSAAEPERTAPGARFPTVLVLGSLTLLLVIRAFTELLSVLPRAANFVDIPIFVLLGVAAAFSSPATKQVRAPAPALVIAFLFLAVFALAAMTNLTRVEPAPALMFLYGFIGPVVVFYAVHRLWIPGSAVRLSRLLVVITVLQLVLAFGVQLPEYLATKNPDVIAGTFGENAYQLVFFLLVSVGLLAGIFTFERRRLVSKLVPFLLLAVMVVIFLAQYRSLLITTFLTTLLLGAVLSFARGRGALIGILAVGGLLCTLVYVAQNVPELKFGTAIEQSRGDPTSFVKQRLGPAQVVGQLYTEDARFILTGTGPGTYSSRGWQTFARAAISSSGSNVAGDYVKALTNGRLYTTDVSDKYVVPQLLDAEVVDGSRALSSPFSSYLSLLAEVGVLGFALIVGLYVWAFLFTLRMTMTSVRTASDGDPLPALLCASTVSMFVLLQMAVLENWFEVTRLTFLAWIVFAVVTKEFNARRVTA